jgi:hypothetical protein
MNERIRELALQAGTTGVRQVWFTRPELEKFAELIVRECCSIIEKQGMNMVPGYLMRLTVPTEIQIINEHFGVDE